MKWREKVWAGTQGYYSFAIDAKNNLIFNEVGRCLGNNLYLRGMWGKNPETCKIAYLGTLREGWDSKSAIDIKEFDAPSPALFGME